MEEINESLHLQLLDFDKKNKLDEREKAFFRLV